MKWRKLQNELLLEPPEEVAMSSNSSMTKRCVVTQSLFRELLLKARGPATLGEAPQDKFGAQDRCRHYWWRCLGRSRKQRQDQQRLGCVVSPQPLCDRSFKMLERYMCGSSLAPSCDSKGGGLAFLSSVPCQCRVSPFLLPVAALSRDALEKRGGRRCVEA